MMRWSDNGGWAWFWMALMMIAFWGLVALAVVAVIRARGAQGRDAQDRDAQDRDANAGRRAMSPEDILADRFARGDIDVDDYRRRSDELLAHRRS